jgi:hypothetical protein
MLAYWVVALALAGSPGDKSASAAQATTESSSVAEQKAAPAPRTGRELETAARAALKKWAHPKDAETGTAAREFLKLYEELRQDTGLAPKVRTDLGRQVRLRLKNLATQITKALAKQSREKAGPKSVAKGKEEAVMAQWGAGVNRGGMMGGGMMGGGMPGGAMQGGAPANDDYGPDLVDLIQKTVYKDIWDVNNGPATIHYWRQGRALIVTAPDEVHEALQDTVQQMERMNR